MNRLVSVLLVGCVVGYAYVRGYLSGYESGKEDGRLSGAREAMKDLGMSDETILSQTT